MITKKYGVGGEAVIASYAWTDIANGLGMVKFHGFEYTTTPAEAYHLGSSADIFSEPNVDTEITAADFTANFDTSIFNLPQTVKGTAIVRVQTMTFATAPATVSYDVTLQKIDVNSVVTNLAVKQSRVVTGTGAALFKAFTYVIPLDETHFAKGDKLRLVLTLDGSDWGNITRAVFGHDPKARAGTYLTPAADYPTNLDVFIPFKIDL